MRQQRNDEAKALIGTRVGTAKAIFSQHSASGQMHGNANAAAAAAANRAAAPAKPARNSIAQRINSFNNAAVATATTPKSPPVIEVADVIKSHIPAAVHEETEDTVAEMKDETEKTVSMAPVGDVIEPPVNRSNGHEAQTIAEDEQIHTQVDVPVADVHSAMPATTVAPVYEEVGDQYSTIKRSPYTKQNSTASSNSQVATPVEPEPPTTMPEVQVVVAKTTTTSITSNAISASDASRGVVIKNGETTTYSRIEL